MCTACTFCASTVYRYILHFLRPHLVCPYTVYLHWCSNLKGPFGLFPNLIQQIKPIQLNFKESPAHFPALLAPLLSQGSNFLGSSAINKLARLQKASESLITEDGSWILANFCWRIKVFIFPVNHPICLFGGWKSHFSASRYLTAWCYYSNTLCSLIYINNYTNGY